MFTYQLNKGSIVKIGGIPVALKGDVKIETATDLDLVVSPKAKAAANYQKTD